MTRPALTAFALAGVASLFAGALHAQVTNDSTDDAALTMTGVDLYMHKIAATGGEAQTPTFWVHADTGRLLEGEQVWRLKSTEAVIYRENEVELTLSAESGAFDQDDETAELSGRVELATHDLTVTAESIVWDNAEGRVHSQSPVGVSSARCNLDADAIELTPESGDMALTNARGTLSLAGEEK